VWWSIREIFTVFQNGLKTDRDELFFDFDSQMLEERMCTLFDKNYGDDFKQRYRVFASSSFDIETRRDQTVFDRKHIKQCLYRPFDTRYLYYDPNLTSRPAYKVMHHALAGENLCLITTRQTKFEFTAIATTGLSEKACANSLDINTVFPLYLYPTKGEMQFEGGRRSNLSPECIKVFSDKLDLNFIEDGKGDLEETFGPEDIFNYAYAVSHSPTYCSRYAEFLKIDFPRLPFTSDKELFKALVAKGTDLVSLHLMESHKLNNLVTKYPIVGSNQVETVRYDEANQRVYINKAQHFEGVSPGVWGFHIGGYQVCHKWLKDRKGRILTFNELLHYQKIIVALKETIRLMEEIDQLVPNWPIE